LDKCAKTGIGKLIYFTKEQWVWVSFLLTDFCWIWPYEDPEELDMSNKEHVEWLNSYNRYMEIVEKEEKGFRFPICGCRYGYACQYTHMKIDDKIYKRDTGHIYDDQESIDFWLKEGKDMKSIYEWIHSPCSMCGTFYGNVHHLPCLRERCPICGGQFVSCGHDRDVIYCKGLEDRDGLFHRGFNDWLTPANRKGNTNIGLVRTFLA